MFSRGPLSTLFRPSSFTGPRKPHRGTCMHINAPHTHPESARTPPHARFLGHSPPSRHSTCSSGDGGWTRTGRMGGRAAAPMTTPAVHQSHRKVGSQGEGASRLHRLPAGGAQLTSPCLVALQGQAAVRPALKTPLNRQVQAPALTTTPVSVLALGVGLPAGRGAHRCVHAAKVASCN